MLGNWRLVHRGVLVCPEVLEGIFRDALLLGVSYHARQITHIVDMARGIESRNKGTARLNFLVFLHEKAADQGY